MLTEVQSLVLAEIAERFPAFMVDDTTLDWDCPDCYHSNRERSKDLSTAKHLNRYIDWSVDFSEFEQDTMVDNVVFWCSEAMSIYFFTPQEALNRQQQRENEAFQEANATIHALRIEAPVGSAEWFRAIEERIADARTDRGEDFTEERRMERWADARFAGGDFWADEDYIDSQHSNRIGALEEAFRMMQRVMPLQYGKYLESKIV
jgi:hypothetical protein